MRKADLISEISDKTGIPKVDVMVTLETMFKEIKLSLIAGENTRVWKFYYKKKGRKNRA
jgi:DNA-binding protein HU-beta